MKEPVNGKRQKGQAVFQPAARLLRLLGEELISDEIIAVSELVKNAHDADASQCIIRFTAGANEAGEITVEDDGCGMNLDSFLKGWMQPGGSPKRIGVNQKTPKGRRVLGEKGVGRFAADKLARNLELFTRRVGGKEIHAEFCWDDYEEDGCFLSDVKNSWEVHATSQVHSRSGTVLRMHGLRAKWNERMFRRLSTRLTRLQSPFGTKDRFKIIIDSDEYPDYSGELRNDFLKNAPYQLQASFDGDDAIELQVGGRRSSKRWPGPGKLTCGPVKIRLYAFDLDTTSLSRLGPHAEIRAWLRDWSGVSVYRDDFRVWPYGEPHDDWLGLDQRRVNNPVVRLSNNQVIGFVEISRDANPQLLDQTNREGLIHNPALDDLRRLVHHMLLEIENHRQTIRHPAVNGTSNGTGIERQDPIDALEKIASGLPVDAAVRLRKAKAEIDRFLEKLTENHQKTLESYAELAASGQILRGVESELRTALASISDASLAVEDHLRSSGERVPRPLSQRVGQIREIVDLLDQRLSDLGSLGVQGERRRTVDLQAEIKETVRLLADRANRHKVEITVKVPGSRQLARADVRPENVRRIVFLLFENALNALAGQKERKVTIDVWVSENHAGFDFSDNGPGFPPDQSENVFVPHFTTNPGAAGMGLTIVRDICRAHGGDATVLVDGRRRGATVRIELKRKQARATL
jgi:signal transduction histidine kinase